MHRALRQITIALAVTLASVALVGCEGMEPEEELLPSGEGKADLVPTAFEIARPFTAKKSFAVPCKGGKLSVHVCAAAASSGDGVPGDVPLIKLRAKSNNGVTRELVLTADDDDESSDTYYCSTLDVASAGAISYSVTVSVPPETGSTLTGNGNVFRIEGELSATCGTASTPSRGPASPTKTPACRGTAAACTTGGDCGLGCNINGSCTGGERRCSTGLLSQFTCQSQLLGCSWLADSCLGTPLQCNQIATDSQCAAQLGCSWADRSVCSGSPIPCSELDQRDCSQQPGCAWQ